VGVHLRRVRTRSYIHICLLILIGGGSKDCSLVVSGCDSLRRGYGADPAMPVWAAHPVPVRCALASQALPQND
jgi:hypothetical protein